MALSLTQRQDSPVVKDEPAHPSEQEKASTAEAELVQRILATPAFTRSVLLTRFLLYICGRKSSGREEEITEHQIGVHALGRPDTYNPGEDNVVRNYARILRKRLEEYFQGEGRDEPLRLVVPVGHYVPVFEPNRPPSPRFIDGKEAANSLHSPDSAAQPGKAQGGRWRSLGRLGVPAAVLLAICVSAFVYREYRARPVNLNDTFWREVFNRGMQTYVVPGDSGLAMMQEITGKEVHLSDYIAGNLDEKFHDFNLAAARGGPQYGFDRISNYTSKADLSIAVGVAKLAQIYGGQLKVCYSRDMNMESFKDSNVILIGGPRANPWVELFDPISNFRMYFPMRAQGIDFDQRTFINKHPRAGEEPSYTQAYDVSHTYALLSFLPEPNGPGHVLLLEGQGMAGTQAAGDFLLDAQRMEPILKRAQLADNSIGPFEILLEARIVGASAPEVHPVIERFGISKATD